MTDLAAILRNQAASDHKRGCQGRCYSCECGYDRATEGLLGLAADRIEALEKALADIIAANKDFREGMPADWEGDLLQDACEAARQLLGDVGGSGKP